MKTRVEGDIVIFEGVLDETDSLEDLQATLKKIKQSRPSAITVDFSKVSSGNSSGILVWLKAVYGAAAQVKYVNAPVWLVNQFNSIRGYFENKSYVESFFAPFFNESQDQSFHVQFIVGKDIPIQKDYSNFTVQDRVKDGLTYQPDFDPQQYFGFISRHLANFQTKNSGS